MSHSPHSDDAPMDAAMASLEPGFLVGNGRFTLIRLIGRGGMGVVWLARDESLREDVALKFLPQEIRFDAAALDDLRRETARARKLTHPNIIRIHDLYKDEREAFISMEYIDGPNLADLRVGQPERVFTWKFLEPLVKQLCDALDYAHGEKVVHRDLKPANMMLDSRGRLKLSDFGIAAQVSDSVSRVSMIRHGQSGTITYMSPQQMDGKLPQVTDDIYALGATLYELLASRPPFFTGDIAHQVRNLLPQPLDERLAELGIENEVPASLRALIMACLGKTPEQRPSSARAVAEWIGLPPAPPATDPAPKPATNPPIAPPSHDSFESVLSPTPTISASDWNTVQEETSPVVDEDIPTPSHSSNRPSWLIRAAAVSLILAFGIGSAVWWFYGRNQHRTADSSTGSTTPATDPLMVREAGWFGGLASLPSHQSSIADVAFSADGRWFASLSSDAVLRVYEAGSGRMVSERTVGSAGEAKALAILLSQQAVAVASVNGLLEQVPLVARGPTATLSGHAAPVLDVAAAGLHLVSGDQNGEMRLWSPDQWTFVKSWNAHPGGVRSLAVEPRGQWAVTGGKDSALRVWSLPDGGLLATLSGHRDEIRSVAVSLDGRLVASTSRDRSLRLWTTGDWKLKRTAQWGSQVNWNFAVTFSPDSRFAVAGGPRGSLYVYDVETAGRGTEERLSGLTGVVNAVAFSPDGSVVVGGDETGALRIWRFIPAQLFPRAKAAAPPLQAETSSSWTTLFNGTSLDSWKAWQSTSWIGAWSILEQELHSLRGGTVNLATREQYGDFELELEWKVTPGANSGIIYRAPAGVGEVWKFAPEYQILDDATHRDGRTPNTATGSLFGLIAPTNKVLRPAGEFNSTRIVARGSHVEHWLNGTKILETDLSRPDLQRVARQRFEKTEWGTAPRGHIVLQHLGSEVSFRNIRVQRLDGN